MRIVCDHCGAIYNISEEKLRRDVSKASCRRCGQAIIIRKPQSYQAPLDLPPDQESTQISSEAELRAKAQSFKLGSPVPAPAGPEPLQTTPPFAPPPSNPSWGAPPEAAPASFGRGPGPAPSPGFGTPGMPNSRGFGPQPFTPPSSSQGSPTQIYPAHPSNQPETLDEDPLPTAPTLPTVGGEPSRPAPKPSPSKEAAQATPALLIFGVVALLGGLLAMLPHSLSWLGGALALGAGAGVLLSALTSSTLAQVGGMAGGFVLAGLLGFILQGSQGAPETPAEASPVAEVSEEQPPSEPEEELLLAEAEPEEEIEEEPEEEAEEEPREEKAEAAPKRATPKPKANNRADDDRRRREDEARRREEEARRRQDEARRREEEARRRSAAAAPAPAAQQGGVPAAVLKTMLTSNRNVKVCFAKYKQQTGSLPRGTINVRITIAPSGSVTSSSIAGGAYAGTSLDSCLSGAIAGIGFPGFQGSAQTYTFPFVLN